MAKYMKTCRVCGKKYEVCRSFRHNVDSVFRWQEVACSPECGAIYLSRVNKARGITATVNESEITAHVAAEDSTARATHKRKKKVSGEKSVV